MYLLEQEYWVDRASGQVCQSLSGRALNIMEIEHTGMWEWIPAMPGSRFVCLTKRQNPWVWVVYQVLSVSSNFFVPPVPEVLGDMLFQFNFFQRMQLDIVQACFPRFKEVAYKKGSDHTEVRGRIECCLPPGSYLISWRLQVGMQPIYRANRAVQRDFTLQHTMPCRFSMWTGDDGCHNISERFLDCMQRPEGQFSRVLSLLDQQNQVCGWWGAACSSSRWYDCWTSLHCFCFNTGDDKWLEYDGGEFTVERQDQPFDLHFSLMEMTAGVWRSGLLLDCVVIRPTHLTSKSHRKVEVLVADEDPSEVLWYLPTVGALWGRSGASSKPRGTRQKKDGNCILVNGPFPDSQKV
jgi:hypothetical protein